MSDGLKNWVAVPQQSAFSNLLFSKRTDNGRVAWPLPGVTESKGLLKINLNERCLVLSIRQRCADWFILSQFRVTGTNAGKLLVNNPTILGLIGLSECEPVDLQPKDMLSLYLDTWFSSSRSAEAMMRGRPMKKPSSLHYLKSLSLKLFISVECSLLRASHS